MKKLLCNEREIENLIREIKILRFELNVLKSAIYPKNASWAATPLGLAERNGLRQSPCGDSLDFCRIVELLTKLNLLT